MKTLITTLLAPVVTILLAALWMYIIVETQDSTGLMCWLFALAAGLSVSPTPIGEPATQKIPQTF